MDQENLRFISLLCLFALGPSVDLALSHHTKYVREFYVSIGKNKTELHISYVVPAGDRSFKIRKRFDTNRDGFLDDIEIEHLKRYMVQDALKGVRITFQGRPVRIYAQSVKIELARESISSLEIKSYLVVPIWLALHPPPPYFEVGIVEERFQKAYIALKSDFRVRFSGGSLLKSDGVFHGEIKRAKPFVIRVFPS